MRQKKTSLLPPSCSTTSGAERSLPVTSISAGAAREPGLRTCTETSLPMSPSSSASVSSKSTLAAIVGRSSAYYRGRMGSYGALLGTPRIARLYASMTVARLSIGLDGIATVLFLRHQGRSFAIAGAAAGALALGSALGAPFIARLIDRLSARVLAWLAVGHAAGLLGLIALTLASAPSLLLVVTAFVTGLTLPTVSSVLRSAYAKLLDHDRSLIASAFALEAVITESIFVVGPLTTAVLTWIASAAAALVVSAVTVVAGTMWFLAELPPEIADHRSPEAGERHWAGALRSP